MARLLDVVLDFFENEQWPVQVSEDGAFLTAGFLGESGEFRCTLLLREREQQILFYAHYPDSIPEVRRGPVMEFITRANLGLYIGNFELDLGDGEVRYKTSADVEDTEIGASFVQKLVYPALSTMDRYAPGIQRLVEESVPPALLIHQIENS